MTSLFIDRRSTELEYHSGAIIFRNKGERIGTIPMAPLTRVFLRGDVKLSASLLGKLGEKGVGVIVLSGRGKKPTLLLARPHNDAKRRVVQIKSSLDKSFCLNYAKGLVHDKLTQQIQWFEALRDSDMHARYELTRAKKQLIKINKKTGTAQRWVLSQYCGKKDRISLFQHLRLSLSHPTRILAVGCPFLKASTIINIRLIIGINNINTNNGYHPMSLILLTATVNDKYISKIEKARIKKSGTMDSSALL